MRVKALSESSLFALECLGLFFVLQEPNLHSSTQLLSPRREKNLCLSVFWRSLWLILTFSILSLSHVASGLTHHSLFLWVITLEARTDVDGALHNKTKLLLKRTFLMQSSERKTAFVFLFTGRRGVCSPPVVSARSTLWCGSSTSSWCWRCGSRRCWWRGRRSPLQQETHTHTD